ncbi:MAG: hypothetical protein MR298_07895 [Odoribacter sp.]|nr:hypothetical protein [Odoribacter sp.]
MMYLVVDGELHGTGIRDRYEGWYLEPSELGLSDELTKRIDSWLLRYWKIHYKGYTIKYKSKIEELDEEGREIARAIKQELQDVKVEYYSDGFCQKEMI